MKPAVDRLKSWFWTAYHYVVNADITVTRASVGRHKQRRFWYWGWARALLPILIGILIAIALVALVIAIVRNLPSVMLEGVPQPNWGALVQAFLSMLMIFLSGMAAEYRFKLFERLRNRKRKE